MFPIGAGPLRDCIVLILFVLGLAICFTNWGKN